MIKQLSFFAGAVVLLALLAVSILTSRQAEKEARRQDDTLRPGYDNALAAAQQQEVAHADR
jgi:hypothetical protein